MKVGFVGNTNNYPFMLAKEFRHAGHEVIFIVDRKEQLHRPEHRYAEIRFPYPNWIVDGSGVIDRYLSYIFPNRRVAQLLSLLEDCDLLIVNGLWPITVRKLRIPYFILLTGADLSVYTDKFAAMELCRDSSTEVGRVRFLFRKIVMLAIIRCMRKAIAEAIGFNYFPRGAVPSGDMLLNSIGFNGVRTEFMVADIKGNEYCPPPNNERVRVLCVSRLNWCQPVPPGFSPLDYKGTDIFLRGYRHYLEGGGESMRVVLVRKGLHVKETEDLVEELALQDSVEWRDEMSQRQLRDECARSDIIVEQLSTSVVGMAGLDAMAMGRPIVANARPEIFERVVGGKTTICHSTTPEEVSAQLGLLASADYRRDVGIKSREYVLNNFSPLMAAEVILSVANGSAPT